MLSENTILGDKCEMSDRWLFLAELCVQDIKSHVRNKIIHSLLWITNFWSHVMWFAIDFHLWLSHSWKSLANHLTPGQKIFIHGNSCIILYGFMTTHGFGWRIHLRSGICPICNMKLASVFFITSCYFFSNISSGKVFISSDIMGSQTVMLLSAYLYFPFSIWNIATILFNCLVSIN